ncbi:MAG: hypothetical protein N2312_06405, partial [Dictyoglomaceae bacterium]|nr:hypothetical protein [Dictyoglomaceae bacterium]
MKNVILIFLVFVILIFNFSFSQTQTPTASQTQTSTATTTKPGTVFVLHLESFSKIYKSNFEKNLRAFDDTFKFGTSLYHPIIGLNISCYTKTNQKGLPYPTLVNRVLKELLPILNDIILPPKTSVNIIIMVQDKNDPFLGKTIFINIPYQAIKDFMTKKDQEAFAKQIIVLLEADKLNYQ